MARATILESLGGGLYRVQLHFDNTRVDTRLTYITEQLAGYVTQLAEIEPARIAKAAELNAALVALNDYINNTDSSVYVADPTELNALTKASYTLRGELDVILHDEKIIKLKKASLEQEQAFLTINTPASFETNAWCVELNEALTGTTGTIDIDYAQIRSLSTNNPLYDTGVWLPGTASTPADNLQHPFASSEHATWFNLCMAPGLQRHAARYRVATISNLDQAASTCDVTFDGIESIDTGTGRLLEHLPIYPQINGAQAIGYAGAPIVYGVCNGYAFADGDRVIVDLHSGVGAPTVIGFYANPRACDGQPGSDWGGTGGQNYDWTLGAGDYPAYYTDYVGGVPVETPIYTFISGDFNYNLRVITTKTGTTSTAALWQDQSAVNNTITVRKSASEGNRTTIYNYAEDNWGNVTVHWSISYDSTTTTTETRDAYTVDEFGMIPGLYNRTLTVSETKTMTLTLSVTLPPALAAALGTGEQIVYTYSLDEARSESASAEYSLFYQGPGEPIGYAAYRADQPVPAVTMTLDSTEIINDETFTFHEFNSNTVTAPSTYDRWQHSTTTTIVGSDTGQIIPITEAENTVIVGSLVESNIYSTDGAVTSSSTVTTEIERFASVGAGNDMSTGDSDVIVSTELPTAPSLVMRVNLA